MVLIRRPTQKRKLFFKPSPTSTPAQRRSIQTANVGVAAFNRSVLEGQTAAAQREAERKAILLADTRARQKASREVARERQRVLELEIKLRRQNAQIQQRRIRDQNTNERILLTTLINERTGEQVLIQKNLDTGVEERRTFERSNGSAKFSGGIRTEKGKTVVKEKKKEEKKVKTGTFTLAPEPKGKINKLLALLNRLQTQFQTQSIKTKQQDTINELKLLGVTTANVVIGGTVAIITLPVTIANFAKNPSKLKGIPSALKGEAVLFGQTLRVSPTTAFAQVGGNILLLKGTGTAFRVIGKVSNPTVTRLGLKGKFRKIDKGKITFSTTGKTTIIRTGGSTKSLGESLAKQAGLAGKKVTAVSAQADRLVNIIKPGKIIRKPLPGEAKLPKATKKLLKKFDKGIISKRELIRLNNQVPILERSFFADPRGRFRPSRFGKRQRDASLRDFLTGDISFRASKPQILVFTDVTIQKFPKGLKDIEKALKRGKKLTPSQAQRLIRFQTTPSGLFKPVGKLSREPEILGAGRDIVKRVKKVGVTLTKDGRTVDIVLAKLVKAKPVTARLLKKSKRGKLTRKELKQLRNNLRRETGFNPRLSSRRVRVRPRVRLPKRAPRRITRRRKAPKRVTRVPKRAPTRTKAIRPIRRAPKRAARTTARRPLKRAPVLRKVSRVARAPPRPPKTFKAVKGIKRKRIRRVIIKKKTKKSFEVFAKPVKGRKLIKVSKRPLSRTDARNLRNFIIDTSLSRTGLIKTRKGSPRKPKIRVPKGFAKKTTRKFRRFRRIRGRRVPLKKGKVIERRRNLLDTRQERKKITLARRIKQLSKPRGQIKKKLRVRSKRKKRLIRNVPTASNTVRRRELLRRLAKARMIKGRIGRARQSRNKSRRTALAVRLRRKISIV